MPTSMKNLGTLLVEKKLITRDQLDAALEIHEQTGQRLGRVLLDKNFITEDRLTSILEKQLDITIERSIREKPAGPVFSDLSPALCREMLVAPVESTARTIRVYFSDPTNVEQVGRIQFQTGKDVDVLYATEQAVQDYLKQYAGSRQAVSSERPKSGGRKTAEDRSPAVRYVDNLVRNAVSRGVSDIHLEIYPDYAVAKYRSDGSLVSAPEPPRKLYPEILSRIKYLANLDLAQSRLPQDGNIPFSHEGHAVDIRVSIVPSIHGENAVLRILDQENMTRPLDRIGFPQKDIRALIRDITRPEGLILFTGPTGSGKTTSLYSILQFLKPSGRKILTIEDPVEYQINDIVQVQARPEIGMTFAAGLRSFLRHDPDVILVGEIRDAETAEIAIRSAMTGRLVFSTLHTAGAVGAVYRLLDMGVPRYLVSSTLKLVVAQRLVRALCDRCREPKKLTRREMTANGLSGRLPEGSRIYFPKGCKTCGQTGYRGRIALFEFLRPGREFQDAVNRGAPEQELRQLAAKTGWEPLADTGLAHVKSGKTSLEEILRIRISDGG